MAAMLVLGLSACGTQCDDPAEPAALPPSGLPHEPHVPPKPPAEPVIEIMERQALIDFLAGMGVKAPKPFMVPDGAWFIRTRTLFLASRHRHGPYLIVEYGGELVVSWRERDLWA
jgi:hypothetical protein